MLELVSIFLATFVIAALLIWLYRMFFGVQNYQNKSLAKKRAGSSMRLSAQQGYISLRRKSQKSAGKTKAKAKISARPGLRVASGRNKVPWGW